MKTKELHAKKKKKRKKITTETKEIHLKNMLTLKVKKLCVKKM